MDAIAAFAEHVVGTRLRRPSGRGGRGDQDLHPGFVRGRRRRQRRPLGSRADRRAAAPGARPTPPASGCRARRCRLRPPPCATAIRSTIPNTTASTRRAVVHPMAVLLAATTAYAERAGGVSGREFLTAIALGVDVGVGLGIASKAPLRFFRPATAGAFAATAAIGRLRGFDAPTLINAFSIGLRAAVRHHAGACRRLAAARPADRLQRQERRRRLRSGGERRRRPAERPGGAVRLSTGCSRAITTCGRSWAASDKSGGSPRSRTSRFPAAGRPTACSTGVLGLMNQHGFAAPEVERIDCRVPPLTHRLVARPARAGMTSNYARLSAP